jgi:hypothetical protein
MLSFSFKRVRTTGKVDENDETRRTTTQMNAREALARNTTTASFLDEVRFHQLHYLPVNRRGTIKGDEMGRNEMR